MNKKRMVVTGSVTRPNDTTQYAAGDVITNSTSVPTVITFSNCAGYQGGGGWITGMVLVDSANQATKPTLELWLFDTSYTPANDNAAFAPTDAVMATCLGVVSFDTVYVGLATVGADGNSLQLPDADELPVEFKTLGNSRHLYGVLVVRNTYMPVASETFTIRLKIEQD